MMARLYWYLDPPSPHKLKKEEKNVVKVGPPLTKLSGSAHISQQQLSIAWRLNMLRLDGNTIKAGNLCFMVKF